VRLALLLTGDPARVEQLVQDAFVGVLEEWTAVGSPRDALRRAVVAACHSQAQRRRKELRHGPGAATRARSSDPEADLTREVLGTLPEDQRKVLVLSLYEDLQDDAIAELLGIRTATVSALLLRGQFRVRQELPGEARSDLVDRLRAYARTATVSSDGWERITARTGATQPQQAEPRAQVAQKAPEEAATRRQKAEEPLLPSPTVAPRHAQHAPPRTRAWPRRVLIGLNIFIALCLNATASGYGYLRWRFGQIDKINLGSILRNGGDDDPGNPTNVLLVGSDTRENVTAAESKKFGTSKDVGGKHSDTIMILHADPRAEKAAILSIPRDLYVTIAGTGRRDRINTAIQAEDGERRLIETIRQELGIQIDHYAEVDFYGFRGIVSSVGGVTIPFTSPARDTVTGLKVPTAGCVELDGDQALAYARSRHYQSYESGRWRTDPTGDLGRISRQQNFIRRMMKQAIGQGIRNPIKANSIIGTATKYVKIDNTLSTADIRRLAGRFKSLAPEAVDMLSLPVSDLTVKATGAAVLELKEPEAQAMIDRFNGIVETPETPAALPKVIPGSIRVRVLNGTGQGGQASKASLGLQKAGFSISGTGDAPTFKYTRSLVRYGTGQRDKALVLQAYVDGGAQIVEDSKLVGGDLQLVTGSSFVGIRTPGTTPRPGATTTTTGAPSKAATRGAPLVLNC
jgi:LCP family protein required for cell wall assembly